LQTTLNVHFVDNEKAFDSVHGDSFWLIMQSYGIPFKIISIVIVDNEKAFDSVHGDSFWLIMQSYGIPFKIISIVRHSTTYECAVMDERDTTEWFNPLGRA